MRRLAILSCMVFVSSGLLAHDHSVNPMTEFGTTASNVFFTVYLLLAGMSDNVLKQMLLGRGVDVPMPIVLFGALGVWRNGSLVADHLREGLPQFIIERSRGGEHRDQISGFRHRHRPDPAGAEKELAIALHRSRLARRSDGGNVACQSPI